MNDREGTYQAMWFLKQDLKEEKSKLLEDMREISFTYWAGTNSDIDKLLTLITNRVEEINKILLNVDSGFYKLEE